METKMKLGSSDWNLWSLTRDYDKIFEILKLQNITNVELGIYQPSIELTADKREQILKTARKHDVTVTALLFSLTPDYWTDGAFSNVSSDFLHETTIFLAAAQAMQVQNANIWTGVDYFGCDESEVKMSIASLDTLGNTFDGIISIEYKAETIFATGAVLAGFLSSTKNLKVLIDTGHAFALEEDVVGLIEALNERGLLGAMHLGDALAGESDADLPCGRVHDFAPILHKLKEVAFGYSLNFDLYGAAMDENGPGAIAILAESKTYIDRLLAGMDS